MPTRLIGAVAVLLLLPLGACSDADPAGAGDAASSPADREQKADDGREGRPDEDHPGGASDPGGDAGELADEVEDLAQAEPRIAPRTGPVIGADISWPQCPKGMGIPEKRTLGMPMPVDAAEYVVLGLTNGPAFTPNPCLADQVAWVKDRGLMAAAYSVTSYPDDATLRRLGDDGPFNAGSATGRLRNVGYQQALYNIATLEEVGLDTPVVWIDVEPVTHFEWSSDLGANAHVVAGVARGYTDAGYRIGIYSTPYLWAVVVGDFSLGGVPEWRAAGQTSQREALDRCGPDWSIQGGPAVMGQWVEARRDMNVTCPGISADLARWFHPY